MTIQEQADFLRSLVCRATMQGGDIAGETFIRLEKIDAQRLDALALRLERIAPHENAIRKMVMG